MDIQSGATMAEFVIASNNNSITNTSGGSNKRKRRSSGDGKDIENKRPPNKKPYSPSADVLDEIVAENVVADLDLYPLGSPQAIAKLSKSENGHTKNQQSRPSNPNNSTTLNNNNNTNMNNNGVTAGGAELTPQSLKKADIWNACNKCCAKQTSDFRLCPLPVLSWADAKDVWKFMCAKDEKTAIDRDPKMLINHPGLQSRMRAILLDWLIEVCEVYKLHRETYYLALDYLDRYLSTRISISKAQLQLIGITCLFIAAKVEEIYPQKLSEFAYVTDGACREEDILRQELLILTALKWQISPVTIVGWLSVYMQLNANKRSVATQKSSSSADSADASQNEQKQQEEAADDAFVFPQFSGLEYAQTAQLIDLCTLDVAIANYPYSVIAAAAISHTFNKKTAIKLSGLDWATIQPCHLWMEPFFRVCLDSPRICLLENSEQTQSKHSLGHICPNLTADDSHIIQIHTTDMDMFDMAMLYKDQMLQEASPAVRRPVEHVCPPEGLLTPPATNRKSTELQND